MKKIVYLFAVLSISFPVSSQVGVNATGSAPDPSAGLDVDFNNKGFLLPRMTTVERDLINSPASGLAVFNTTTNCLEFYLGGIWQPIGCGCTAAPASPAASDHTATQTQIVWSWAGVNGVANYKINTVNNYLTATDVAANTSYTQTGLVCGSGTHSLYVWAYNTCGVSTVTALSEIMPDCPFICGETAVTHNYVANVSPANTAPYNSTTYTYNTVSGDTYSALGAGKCWTTSNLGATAEASAANDADANHSGWYFQYNRPQGYYHNGSSRTPNTAWANVIENSSWILANDPCRLSFGSTWRIPTQSEWTAFRGASVVNGGMNNGPLSAGYASVLKLHAAGYLAWNTGLLSDRGNFGYPWSSSESSNSQAWAMYLENTSGFFNFDKASGFSLRCIRE